MSVFTCGSGVGLGMFLHSAPTPIPIDTLLDKPIKEIFANEYSVAVITESGYVYTWGRNRLGELGIGTKEFESIEPRHVISLQSERIVTMAIGYQHVIAISAVGNMYEWGNLYRLTEEEYFGDIIGLHGMRQIPIEDMNRIKASNTEYYTNGEILDRSNPDVNLQFGNFVSYIQRTPQRIRLSGNVKFVKASAGYSYSLAISDTGIVYGWGINDKCQLGLGHRYNQYKPIKIAALSHEFIVDVACGQQHSLALTDKGELYSWGLGVFGQLGHDSINGENFPKKLSVRDENGDPVTFVSISCGSYHSAAIDSLGRIWTWGNSEYYQLGAASKEEKAAKENAHQTFRTSPKVLPSTVKFVRIVCGNLHNIALSDTGVPYTWGWGPYGNLGVFASSVLLHPEKIEILRGQAVRSIAGNISCSYFVTAQSPTSFAHHFKPFVNNPTYSDITFVLDRGQVLHGHKVVIFNRCPVLKVHHLFQQRFYKSTTKELHVSGVDANVLRAVLGYLYTHHLDCLIHLIPKVKKLAQRWKITRLVKLCNQYKFSQPTKYSHMHPTLAESRWEEDMISVVNSPQYSDIQLLCDDGTIVYSHRLFLESRSGYFKTLFASSFYENKLATHTLHDFEVDQLQLALNWIYTNRKQGIDYNNMVDMLYTSSRLLIDDLKEYLEMELEVAVDEESAFELLGVTYSTNSTRLKRACHNSIITELEQKKDFDRIHEMMQKDNELENELAIYCYETGRLKSETETFKDYINGIKFT